MVPELKTIGILGEGITATAVRNALPALGLTETTPETADWVIASPGIPPEHYPIVPGEILSEIEFAFRMMFHVKHLTPPPRLIAVTGTNGKSTVTAMIGHILRCPVAGNIGIPLITYVGYSHEFICVEVSSYQLETCSTFQPEIALYLNLTPDHLERHKTLENYAQAKAKIAQAQTEFDTLILAQDPQIETLLKQVKSKKIQFSKDHPKMPLISTPYLVGEHNHLNGLAAVLACEATKTLSLPTILERLSHFKPLEHRIEWVKDWQGRKFYNDSKGTNPDATLIAVRSFEGPTHLILGGKDKHLPLDKFVSELPQQLASISLFGESGPRFHDILSKLQPQIPRSLHTTLSEATQSAADQSHPGDIILLSPACSSFDQFKNFEERGQIFKTLVHSYYVS